MRETGDDRSNLDSHFELGLRREKRFEIFSRRDVVTALEVREADRVKRVRIVRRLFERDRALADRVFRVAELAEDVRERDARAEMRRREPKDGAIRVARRLELTDLVERDAEEVIRVRIRGVVLMISRSATSAS